MPISGFVTIHSKSRDGEKESEETVFIKLIKLDVNDSHVENKTSPFRDEIDDLAAVYFSFGSLPFIADITIVVK